MRIILIVVYFGPKPKWLAHFLISCEFNSTIDWLLYTDIKIDQKLYKNIILVPSEISDFNSLVSKKLGFNSDIIFPYKLCDFKPTYGKIFEDYIHGYDFWGYCDLDIIFGSIGHYINDHLLSFYDIITTERDYLSGHFTIYRNSEKISSLYNKIWNLKVKLRKADRHYYLDEKSNYIGSNLRKKVTGNPPLELFKRVLRSIQYRFWKNLPLKYDISRVVIEEEQKGEIKIMRINSARNINYYTKHGIDNWIVRWNSGRLTEIDNSNEIMYFHLLNTKFNQDIVIKTESNMSIAFSICPK